MVEYNNKKQYPSPPIVSFGGKEAVTTAVRYTNLAFTVLARSHLLILLGLYTGVVTNKVAATIGAAI